MGTEILKILKFFLVNRWSDSDSNKNELTSLREKWQQADYYCCLYEFEDKLAYLLTAYSYIRKNPPPLLYRRICMHLFKHEIEPMKKIMYLFETQSVALRHKACSVQLRHKRKSMADSKIFNTLMTSISFNCIDVQEYLVNFLEKFLPSDFVCVSLILDPDANNLYLIRLEKDFDPILRKLQFDKKFTDSFRQIMIENDVSMKQLDRHKFWTTRNLLNNKLFSFLNELEKNVLGKYKTLMLGSFGDDGELEKKFIADFRKQFANVAYNQEKIECLKLILLGLNNFTQDQVSSLLKTEFGEQTSQHEKWIMSNIKPRIASVKRKHVCLMVDRVNYY